MDLCFALQYYSRLRLAQNLLPLLRKSTRPRLLTVLAGGNEDRMLDEDIGLENPQNYGLRVATVHTTTMTTLSLEYLAENDKHITFIHAFPGLVSTGLFSRLRAPATFGILGKAVFAVVRFAASTLMRLFGMSPLDCGARQAFLLTSDTYSPGQVWRINDKSEPVTKPGALEIYREQGWREKVWNYTTGVFDKALATRE